jgi:TPP-dependent pyruvate/acetoin dehydrogenase alpha subunit
VPAAQPPKGTKAVYIYTEGPLGNLNWQYGDVSKWLPPAEIPEGPAASALAALPKDKLADIYRKMYTARRWETTMKDLFVGGKEGLYGAFHPYVGEEAIANGVMAALNPDDYIASTHRGHGHLIAKGGDINKMAAEIFFRSTGANKGFGGSMHITELDKGILGMNGIVGPAWYFAAGAAYTFKVRGTKQVAVALAGEGATNSVYYFSAVRNATNYTLPAVFVIENNFQNIAVPAATVTPTKYAADLTKGLGIPCTVVDGNDVAAVYAAAKEAVERARAGGGPSVIEGMTYRWYDHAGFAGAKVGVDAAWGLPYRTDDEVRQWMTRDPLLRYKQWLLKKGLLTEGDLAKIEGEVQAAVDAAVEFARKSAPPAPDAGLQYVYATGKVAPTQFLDATAPSAYRLNPADVKTLIVQSARLGWEA